MNKECRAACGSVALTGTAFASRQVSLEGGSIDLAR